MNKFPFLFVLVAFLGIHGCSTQKNTGGKAYQLSNGQSIRPHQSIDEKEFKIQYANHKELWDKAFEFLKDNDLEKLAVGKYEIVGERCYAVISEYETKSPEKAKIESHKKYIDFQYIVKGKELIDVTSAEFATLKEPYVGARDIMFYSATQLKSLEASPAEFFLFFPKNYHRPGVSADAASSVKKLVIKIENYDH